MPSALIGKPPVDFSGQVLEENLRLAEGPLKAEELLGSELPWASITDCFQCWPALERAMPVVTGSPTPLQAGPCILHCAAGLMALLRQGKNGKFSKLHMVHLVAMAFWDAGGTPRTLIICMCSRK